MIYKKTLQFIMKKALLITCLGGLAALNAAAVEVPKTLQDVQFVGLSANGQWTVSQTTSGIRLFDALSGEEHFIYSTEDEVNTPVGKFISDNGLVLASNFQGASPTYWFDGDWYTLEVPDATKINYLSCVTPDGSRIFGYVGSAALGSDQIAGVPAYWEANGEGGYGTYHILPYPTTDYANMKPQFITLHDVSDDGKVVAGQICDAFGMFAQPIVFIEGEDGQWTYKTLASEYFAPEGSPEKPGPEPSVDPTEYMTEADKAAYDAAYAYWLQDPVTRDKPDMFDYLTDATKLAEYNAAVDALKDEHDAWQKQNEAWQEFVNELYWTLPAFTFAETHLSPDGSTLYNTASIIDDDFNETLAPIIIDVATDKATIAPGHIQYITSVIDSDTYLGYASDPQSGYLVTYLQDGKTETTLYDYLVGRAPSLTTWAEETLIHNIPQYDEELDQAIPHYYTFTGRAYASRDLKTISFSTESLWNEVYVNAGEGWIVNFDLYNGVEDIRAPKAAKLAFDANGNITADTELSAVEVYDLSGRQVIKTAGTEIGNSLSKGVYLVKALGVDGSVYSARLAK